MTTTSEAPTSCYLWSVVRVNQSIIGPATPSWSYQTEPQQQESTWLYLRSTRASLRLWRVPPSQSPAPGHQELRTSPEALLVAADVSVLSDMASWDANGGGDMLLANRRVHIIDDLLGAVLLLAAGLFAVSLELTRRQICAVYQLAFVLCASWAFFIIGGLVDHHVSDDQLSLALYGSYLSSTSYIYLPIVATVLVSLAFVLHISACNSCECCCLVGDANNTVSSHKPCFEGRIRAHGSLYVACFVSLFVAIGTRLNVRLRGSAINPMGGTVHWAMLKSPFYLSVMHISTLVLIALKLFLQHVRTLLTYLAGCRYSSVLNWWTAHCCISRLAAGLIRRLIRGHSTIPSTFAACRTPCPRNMDIFRPQHRHRQRQPWTI